MEKERNKAFNPQVEIVSLDTLKILEKAELLHEDVDDADEGLSDVEKAEELADRLISKQITQERQQEQQELYGQTDSQVETEADEWLRKVGFDKDGNPLKGKGTMTGSTERIGQIILAPKVSDPIEIYRRHSDPDEQARILNNQIVKLERDEFSWVTKVTPQSVNALISIGSAKRAEISQYRIDVVTSLTHDNLLATANTLIEEDPFINQPFEQVLSTISRIRKLSGVEETLTPKEEKAELAGEIFAELADRLNDDYMVGGERAELIGMLDANWSPALILKMYREHPESLVAMVRSMNEFRDDRLRGVLREFIKEEE